MRSTSEGTVVVELYLDAHPAIRQSAAFNQGQARCRLDPNGDGYRRVTGHSRGKPREHRSR